MAAPQVSYVPSPHEQPYYEGLFQTADIARGGNIGGAEAVAFFSRSKLTVETLKSIWTLADSNPQTNALDRRKFATAIRLIQLAQNGVKAQGPTLGGPPGMRPVMFDGVSGVSVQLPPPEPAGGGAPQQQQQPPQQQYGQPPPQQQQQPSQQQYGQPPPQQQQQPPQQQVSPVRSATPAPQQQQYAAPPTPPQQYAAPPTPTRPPVANGAPPTFSMAITPQDPYTMTPQEQARYEGIFPNYAQDGFVSGKVAVELFGKSGVQTDALGKIWNMVDSPVDNKLDKVEFAMAMHLIVCVSKKGLPVPTSLPISFKSLKSQQPTSAAPEIPEPAAVPAPAAPQSVMSGMSGASSVGGGSYSGGMEPQQQFSAPPPLPQQGAGSVSISDAFEGLDGPASPQGFGQMGNTGGPPPLPSQEQSSFGGVQMGASLAVETIPEPQEEISIPEPQQQQQQQQTTFMEPVAAPAPPPKTTQQLASSYAMGNDSTELAKLKTTLQKLQAENIALKAQMGSMTQEERDIQRETAATIEEISRLSTELSDRRAEVLASKTRLLESTAELSAAKEKRSVMTDLIVETKTTTEALNAAEQDIHEASSKAYAAPSSPIPAPAPVAEADLFGDWGAPAPASEAPAQWGAPPPAASAPAPWSAPAVEAPSDDEDDDVAYGAVPAPISYGAPASEVPTEQFGQQLNIGSSYDTGSMASAPAPSYSAAPTMQAASFAPPPIETSSGNNIDGMKQAAMAKEQSAREADETYRAIAAEAEKLKKVADAAEADARAKQDKADKKRGMGKKKLAKEAETAAIEAAEKKRHFLELQAQASNAHGLAEESRREADKMRNQAEQAELDFAAAESTRDSQPPAADPAPVAAPAPSYGAGMQAPSYGAAAMEGMPDPSQLSQQTYPSYGFDPSNSGPGFNNAQSFGNGIPDPQQQPPDDSFGFDGGMIMGGGQGISIPTPQANENYNNPF